MQTGVSLSGTSAASTSQSDHAPDGSLPKPPTSKSDELQLAGTASAPSVGVTGDVPYDERNDRYVNNTETIVNRKETTYCVNSQARSQIRIDRRICHWYGPVENEPGIVSAPFVAKGHKRPSCYFSIY
jgi:hypothetical protein